MTDDPYADLHIESAQPVAGLDAPTGSSDPVCVVCGDPLGYGGRGRKPKYCAQHKPSGSAAGSGATRARASGDVEVAMSAMDSLYGGMTMLLMAVSPAAASSFAEGIPQAQIQNRLAFQSDKKLTQTINKSAAKGGKGIFVATQVMLFAPAARIAMTDMQARRPVKPAPARPMPAGPDATGSVPTSPPGFVDPVDMNLARSRRR